VTLLIDTGPIVALADANEPLREVILDLLRTERGSLVMPSPTTAEVDYMLGRRFGASARRAFHADLAAGRFSVGCLEREDHATVIEIESRCRDLDLGLTDCALIVLAERYQTTRLLTFDERHFRVVTSLRGNAFTILPADV
jgi:predicted nucleic acid-binding protein